jgi:hypothetical protein
MTVWGADGDDSVHLAIREAIHVGHDPREVREWPLADLELFMSKFADAPEGRQER